MKVFSLYLDLPLRECIRVKAGGGKMKIKDVCAQTGLTRKAIEYYESKGLIDPIKEENGYRFFSNNDVKTLKEISLLRKLELSTSEISEILNSKEPNQVLLQVQETKQLQQSMLQRKVVLLRKLVEGHHPSEINKELEAMEKSLSIKERLLHKFPGYVGKLFILHFGTYLEVPIETTEQEEAYNEVIRFLDNLEEMELSVEIQKLLNEVTLLMTDLSMNDEEISNWNKEKIEFVNNPKTWIRENKSIIQQYNRIKNTDEFLKFKPLSNRLKQFMQSSGYYNIFIPAMCKLSPDYAKYQEQLLSVNNKYKSEISEM
jgi:DNA-binding transcriptional MerR regulator